MTYHNAVLEALVYLDCWFVLKNENIFLSDKENHHMYIDISYFINSMPRNFGYYEWFAVGVKILIYIIYIYIYITDLISFAMNSIITIHRVKYSERIQWNYLICQEISIYIAVAIGTSFQYKEDLSGHSEFHYKVNTVATPLSYDENHCTGQTTLLHYINPQCPKLLQ